MTEEKAHVYRLKMINGIQEKIVRERNSRELLCKRYRKASKIICNMNDAMIISIIGIHIAGIGVLSTIVSAPVVIPIEASALVLGLLSVIGKRLTTNFSLKVEKHEKIKRLIDSELNIISDHISKALNDDVVSDEEFSAILKLKEKYTREANEISNNMKTDESVELQDLMKMLPQKNYDEKKNLPI